MKARVALRPLNPVWCTFQTIISKGYGIFLKETTIIFLWFTEVVFMYSLLFCSICSFLYSALSVLNRPVLPPWTSPLGFLLLHLALCSAGESGDEDAKAPKTVLKAGSMNWYRKHTSSPYDSGSHTHTLLLALLWWEQLGVICIKSLLIFNRIALSR